MANDGSGNTRRMLRQALAVPLGCVLVALVLSGCATTTPPTPTPTDTSIFASEEEALAAATDVYQQYNAAFDEALATGGGDMSALGELTTPEHLEELAEPGMIDENGWHTDGSSSFEIIEVASFESSADGIEISLNLCRDLSAVRILDSSDSDVTPDDWPQLVGLNVRFRESQDAGTPLVVSKVNSWSPNIC
ncbi:hypothetical protein IWX78_003078 [Mycetocola sp. CAN_C7]|uniref:hypothetical protein n=1 Tax=Mycetocola sp. CAN_C7 TaxID=2787724 RepID=UPI0018C9ACDC